MDRKSGNSSAGARKGKKASNKVTAAKNNLRSIEWPEVSTWCKEIASAVTFYPCNIRPGDIKYFKGNSFGRNYVIPKFAMTDGVYKSIRIAVRKGLQFMKPVSWAPVKKPAKKTVATQTSSADTAEAAAAVAPSATEVEEEKTVDESESEKMYVDSACIDLHAMRQSPDKEIQAEARYLAGLVRRMECDVYDEVLSPNGRLRVEEPDDNLPDRLFLSVDTAKVWNAYHPIEHGDSELCLEFKSVVVREREGDKVLDKGVVRANARLTYPYRPGTLSRLDAGLFMADIPKLPTKSKSAASTTGAKDKGTDTGFTTAKRKLKELQEAGNKRGKGDDYSVVRLDDSEGGSGTDSDELPESEILAQRIPDEGDEDFSSPVPTLKRNRRVDPSRS